MKPLKTTVTVACVICLKEFEMDRQKCEKLRAIHRGYPLIFCQMW